MVLVFAVALLYQYFQKNHIYYNLVEVLINGAFVLWKNVCLSESKSDIAACI